MNLSPGYEKQVDESNTVPPSQDAINSFIPRRGLRGPHLQTLASYFLPRRDQLPLPEQRIVEVEDGIKVLCLCHWQQDRRRAFTVIIVHGLEGSSNSQYVIGTANKAWADGMNVVRMNVRSCGGTEALCRTLYHSGMSSDIDAIARRLVADDGIEKIGVVGYSMGGNQVVKLAGEWGAGMYGGAPAEIKAVAAVSPAMDLSISSDALHLRGNRVYEWRFLRSLRSRLRRKLRLFPDCVRVSRWRWSSVRDFDDVVTAPAFGFRDAEDYYKSASASRVLGDIALPTLIINSKDDPFIRVREQTRQALEKNRFITFVETEHGGHCAFLAEPNGYDGRWAERQVLDFLAVHG